LDPALRPTGERWAVTNADTGIAALVTPLQAIAPQLLVREATGSDQRAAGKATNVALTACRRKLLTILNARVQHHTLWPSQEVAIA
jgi:hypothetical protein